MSYNLIITSILNEHSKTIVARMITQKQSISLQKALLIVNNPPFTFLVNASNDEIRTCSIQLSSIGVTFKIQESHQVKKNESTSIPSSSIKLSPKEGTIPNKTILENKPPYRSSLGLSIEEPPAEKKTKKKFPILSIISFSIFFIVPLLLILLSNMKGSFSFSTKVNDAFGSGKKDENKGEKKSEKLHLAKDVNNQEKSIISDSYADSAELYSTDLEKAIKFYQLAISFNQKNYKAWRGLINAYYENNQTDQAHKSEDEMKKIFGDAIFSLEKIIQPYGKIIRANYDDENTYTVEYRTRESKEKALIFETYQIIRALKPECNCLAISLFASHTSSTGLIVHLNSLSSIATLDDFQKSASITYLK